MTDTRMVSQCAAVVGVVGMTSASTGSNTPFPTPSQFVMKRVVYADTTELSVANH